MKGISTVIATILILLIVIALVGIAYAFISGVFTRSVQGLELVDGYCEEGATDKSVVIVRNIGSEDVNVIDVKQTAPTDAISGLVWDPALPIKPGTISTMKEDCQNPGARSCIYRITPKGGRTVSASVRCT